MEKKLFGPKPGEELPALPQLSPEERALKRKIALFSLIPVAVGFAVYFLGNAFIPSKSPAHGIATFGGMMITLFGSSFVAPFFRKRLKSFDVQIDDPQLTAKVQQMAGRMGVKLRMFKIDGTETGRTIPNARATAGNIVAVTARMRDILDEPEIMSVVAHELAHLKLGHVRNRLIFRLGVPIAVFVALSIAIVTASTVRPIIFSIPLAMIPIIFFVGSPMMRRQEYAADRLMLETTRDPDAAISAFQKMVRNSPMPYAHEVGMGQHPAISKRIERLRQIAAELGLSVSAESA